MALTTESIAEVFLSHRLGLTAYLSMVTQNHHLAEDVFQETCVKALGKKESFESTQHLLNWFRVAARNRAIDLIRSRDGKYQGLSAKVLELFEQDLADHQEERKHLIRLLMDCVSESTPRNRELIRLKYFEGWSGEQISQKLNRKIDSIYQAMSRLHKALHLCVSEKQKKAVL
ncbi:MAG: sigma-70 family RNA polymerase sigma factor [Opitutales bacterium]|nr:sigma-70 family RNA polymerase sigma factor [Opitutales bacterium]